MARPASKHPTDLELEILKVLWRDGPSGVRSVRDALAERRDLAYTTVMTMMNIMTEKGYLARAKKLGVYVYRPKITEGATAGGMLHDLMQRAFDGQASAVMLNLIETQDIDPGELKRLRDLINAKIKGDGK